ncbi:hypothetical protein ACQP1W_33685 [Spirillospora sp. CA-255316]
MSLKAIPVDAAFVRGLLELGAVLPSAERLEATLRGLRWPGWQDHDDCFPAGNHRTSHRIPLDLGGGRILHTVIEGDWVTDLSLVFAVFWPPFGRDHDDPGPADGATDRHDDWYGPAFDRYPKAERAAFDAAFDRVSQLVSAEIGMPRAERHDTRYGWRRLAWRHRSCLVSLVQRNDDITLGEYDSAEMWLTPWSPGDPIEPPDL